MEFAIIFPVLLLILAGIVDLGNAFFTELRLANAAREGARAAVVSTLTAAQIQARAQTAFNPTPSSAYDTLTFPVQQQCPSPDNNATLVVRVKFDFIILGPASSLFGASIANPGSLESKAVMKCGG